MNITFLTQYYPPETGAPQRRLSELADRLVAAGHQVTVLTAMPSYPIGKIHDGYGGLVQRETINGVQLIRTFIYPTQKASFVHRLPNYFSFVISSALFGTFLLPGSHFLLVESPPLFLGLSALWLSLIKGVRLIFNVSDLWPETAVALGIISRDGFAYRISAWLEQLFYRRAWLITGQSRSILADIEKRFPAEETFLLSNGVDIQKFGPELADSTVRARLDDGNPAACVALYAGLHGLAQGLDQIVSGAALLKDQPNIRFVLVGDGPEKTMLIESAKQQRLTNILFADTIPAGQIPAWLASADILLVTLKMYIPGAVPSKLYEAMATGRPVILVASGEPAQIVVTHEAGIAVEPGDAQGLVAAVEKLNAEAPLRQRLGDNGRRAASEHFSRDKIAQLFLNRLDKGAAE